jgi:predicted ATPase with chaperone activity
MTSAPAEFTLHPCNGVSAKVKIQPSPNGRQWDAVTINGKSCGNRHGGIRAFTEMVEAVKRAVVVAAAGKHSLHLVGAPNVGKTMLRAVALEMGLAETFESRPCPCGYFCDPRHDCKCTARQIERHRAKFPPAEITIEVPPVPERELSSRLPGTTLAEMRGQIANMAQFTSLELDEHCRNLLRAAVAELGIDAATRESIIRVARTIANLDGRENIEAPHICEAINYRMFR